MTATLLRTPDPTTSVTSSDPTIRQRWKRYRIFIAVAALGLIAAIVVGVVNSGTNNGGLDPRSYAPNGTHALATLLSSRGTTVETVTTLSDARASATRGTTLVVTHPERLDDGALAQVAATDADLVVVEAGPLELGGLNLGIVPGGQGFDDNTTVMPPDCNLPAAVAAGSVRVGAYAYRLPDGGVGCYPFADGDSLVVFDHDGRQVTLLGNASWLANATIADDGNAALALNVLSSHDRLIWFVPALVRTTAGSGGQSTLTALLPGRVKWAALQLVVAVIVLALWRGRRLGRLVPEALPVVVRQGETVVGRARLYRRAQARGRVAKSLRASTVANLATRFGTSTDADLIDSALIDHVATRTGRGAHEVEALLYGPAPSDDHELVALAGRLATLKQEVVG